MTKENNHIALRPYRVPENIKPEIRDQLNIMLEKGIIRPNESEWMAPIVIANKKDGTKRICVDFRKLNEVTVKDKYPLPVRDDIYDKLRGMNTLSLIDLKAGYWQIGLREEDKQKTAFSPWAGGGLYEFNVLPFGLTIDPSTFQRLIDRLLQGSTSASAYIDDVLIYSCSIDQHLKDLAECLENLKGSGLKINREKCKFCISEVEYLGFLISSEGIKSLEKKIQPIIDLKPPESYKELQSFLGLINYYQRFIRNIADKIACMNKL